MVSNKEEKRINITNIILGTIGVVGLMGVAIILPNAIQVLALVPGFEKRKYNKNAYIRKTINRLVENGSIVFVKKDGKTFAKLTEKGKNKLAKYQIQKVVSIRPKKWDGKWRVIIFDVKEYKRGLRDQLRNHLIEVGFIKLQNSVWIYPYPCEEFVFLLKTEIGLGKDIICMTVEKVENDEWIKKEFGI